MVASRAFRLGWMTVVLLGQQLGRACGQSEHALRCTGVNGPDDSKSAYSNVDSTKLPDRRVKTDAFHGNSVSGMRELASTVRGIQESCLRCARGLRTKGVRADWSRLWARNTLSATRRSSCFDGDNCTERAIDARSIV